jgi:hypothetical protein
MIELTSLFISPNSFSSLLDFDKLSNSSKKIIQLLFSAYLKTLLKFLDVSHSLLDIISLRLTIIIHLSNELAKAKAVLVLPHPESHSNIILLAGDNQLNAFNLSEF